MSLLYRICLIGLCVLFSAPIRADLKIDVSGGVSEPTPIASPYFSGDSDLTEKITDIVSADLERSGLFRVVNRDAYIQKIPDTNTKPVFPDWQAIQAQALLYGTVEITPENKIKVSYRLWDIFSQKQMDGKSLETDIFGDRKIAHMIADSVYERITGETGYFDSAVVFVSETGPQKKRIKRLAVMDQDGENVRFLSDGKDTVLTPRFSPKMNKITYLSYKTGEAKVYIMDIDTGKSELVGTFKGMTFAPRFSPDGKKLVMSMAERGNTDIYVYDLENKIRTRLTNHPSIDTSPSFSPDGKQIAFNSDRSGKRQIYVMNSDGTDVKRISFGDGAYATPVWSPRGDYIAYTQIKSGLFHIGVMKTDGSRERLIANGWLIEAPTWAPNGRVLMFYRKSPSDSWGNNGRSKLYSIDITGHNERLIETPKDASDPAWSPLLH